LAESVAAVFTGRLDGGAAEMLTTMGVAVMMFAVADAETVGFVVDVAVIVTVPPAGTAEGAEKVVLTPLAVCVGLTPPQLAAPQLTVQSTPAFATSLATKAVN
jgi:hypothetical protein